MTKPFTHLRLSRPLAVIDVETTGTSPQQDHVVEIAVVKFLPQGDRERFVRRVQPGVPIPASATAIHDITDADVADCPPFEAIAKRLVKFLKHCDLCGFNLTRFDLPFLLAEFARARVHFSFGQRAVIDVMKIYHRFEPRDLAAAVRHYLGKEHANGHQALVDAYATAAVLDQQLACYDELPRRVAELHTCLTEVDLAGRLRREDGQIVLAFGKYRGQPLSEVARADPDYLHWLTTQDCLPDFEALLHQALEDA